jgi:hypothetical protein
MRLLLSITLVLGSCLLLHGGILSMGSQSFDFTKISKEDALITFEPADKLSLTKGGLGWDGDAHSSYEGSFTTAPVATGTAWRPTGSVTLECTLFPATQVFRKGVWKGDLYVRYSPDKKHWSSWQLLQVNDKPQPSDKGIKFAGRLRVPEIDSRRYYELVQEYSKLDVPWQSDEEAAVKWILQKDPEFFAKNQPFIGYVQFHFEGLFRSGERVTALDCNISYSIGGLQSIPKDPNAYKNSEGPWRFDASKVK